MFEITHFETCIKASSTTETVDEIAMQKRHQFRAKMTSSLIAATETVQTLQRRYHARGAKLDDARQMIADAVLVGKSIIDRLVTRRAKRIDADLRDRLHGLLIRDLENEIKRLSVELDIARLAAARDAVVEIGEVEAHLAQARETLERVR